MHTCRSSSLRCLYQTRTASTSKSTPAHPSHRPPPKILVGSPDMISNLRPAIYDGIWFKAVCTLEDPASSTSSVSLPVATLVHPDQDTEHPYALEEFASMEGHERDRFFEEKKSWEMRFRLERQSFDAFNHAFWTDVSAFPQNVLLNSSPLHTSRPTPDSTHIKHLSCPQHQHLPNMLKPPRRNARD